MSSSSPFALNQPFVMDLGSGLTKVGFAGSTEPSAVIGTIVGIPRLQRVLPTSTASVDFPSSEKLGISLASEHDTGRSKYAALSASTATTLSAQDLVVGERLRTLSGVLSLRYPMNNSMIAETDWLYMERLYRHLIADVLHVEDGAHAALITENPGNAKKNRERLAKFFFENMRVPALYIANPQALALYASGRTTGLVLDVGDTCGVAMPVYEGHAAAKIVRTDVAGRLVTQRLSVLMKDAGVYLDKTSSEKEAVRRIKERFAYVANVPREEERKIREGATGMEKEFTLPDGNVVRVAAERFRAAEVLFKPNILGMETPAVHECVHDTVQAADLEARRRLYGSIVLAGGSTKLRGFAQRLLEEVRAMAPRDTKIRIHAPPDRLTSAFAGGAILSSLTTFRNMSISAEEYFEQGEAVVHRKTFR